MKRQPHNKYKRKPQSPTLGTLDALILHSLSDNLVKHVVAICESIGIKASRAIDLPSRRLDQEHRVKYYIQHCTICIAILTFDEEDKASTKSRPNVYEEIGYCHDTRPRNTIILHEHRGHREVQLSSNLRGHLVIIPFDQSKLHELAPKLLKELMSRRELRRRIAMKSTPNDSAFTAGRQFNDFMDRMDNLWDNELDPAWLKIHRQDYDAERDLSVQLDKFFQCYHAAISALVRDRHDPKSLQQLLNSQVERATDFAVRAWEIVANGKMRLADQAQQRRAGRLEHRNLYDAGHTELRKGMSAAISTHDRVRHYKNAIDLLDRYMK